MDEAVTYSLSHTRFIWWFQRVISTKWKNKLLIHNINLTGHRQSACCLRLLIFVDTNVIALFWHWRYQVFPKGCYHHDLKGFYESALNNGKVKSQIFRKASLNFTFGQISCLTSDFVRPNSSKTVFFQISERFNKGIFNNNFAFCATDFLEPVRSSFCSTPWLAWLLLRKIIKRISVFYPLCLKKYWKKLDKRLWRVYFVKVKRLHAIVYLK